MPLGIVSDEDFELECNKIEKIESHIVSNITIEQSKTPGRGSETNAIPQPVREIIAEARLSGESIETIQKAFPVSKSSISAYTNGVTSTANYREKKNDGLEKVRNRVAVKSGNRIVDALNALAKKNLDNESAKDVASIAKDMSTVFDKISPASSRNIDNERTIHLHITRPPVRDITEYEVIDV